MKNIDGNFVDHMVFFFGHVVTILLFEGLYDLCICALECCQEVVGG